MSTTVELQRANEQHRELTAALKALCDDAESGRGPMQSKPSGYVPVVLLRALLACDGAAALHEVKRAVWWEGYDAGTIAPPLLRREDNPYRDTAAEAGS